MTDRQAADLLIELGCEELPPGAVDALRDAFFEGIAQGLDKALVEFDREGSRAYSTPRRLAVLMSRVAPSQPDRQIERRGPSLSAAFDGDGRPTAAASGFARSVGLEVSQLETLETDEGEWLYCRRQVPGKALGELIFPLIQGTLKQLPIPRPMRWSRHEFSFVRPVHWVVAMHGGEVLPGSIFGKASGRLTRGHRVHSPGPHEIGRAGDYASVLKRARVIANPEARGRRIRELAEAEDPRVMVDPAVLAEVNNLVEWPVAVSCRFDEAFLEVPHEALIASMQSHQRFFPVGAKADAPGRPAITNRFIAIINTESRDIEVVRRGLERVIRPRLADARFFLEQDQKRPLADYLPRLDEVVFQSKIGTIGDKTKRIVRISKKLAEDFRADAATCTRAASLCKCDLVTQMVGEFPELQGVIGARYALASGETPEVAMAVGEHYAPRFAGDAIPASEAGRIVSLADRLDTLAGVFAAGLKPSGNKDPFALRRAALGLVRILSEAALPLDLDKALAFAGEGLSKRVPCDGALLLEVKDFIVQRARGHYRERGFGAELINAVLASPWKNIPDLEARLQALDGFMGRAEAASLAAANKRIRNILRKAEESDLPDVRERLLALKEEKRLFDEIRRISQQISPLMAASDYAASLAHLAELKEPVDTFFDDVLVMEEDDALRRNRLALLASLKAQFDQIADLSVFN